MCRFTALQEVEKLKLLKKLIDDSGSSGVVITSDRRYSKVDMEDKTEAFDQFEIFIVGKTRRPNQDDLEVTWANSLTIDED